MSSNSYLRRDIKYFLLNLWRWKIGEGERDISPDLPDNLEETEWNQECENARRARYVMGAFRYGLRSGCHSDKYDLITNVEKRIQAYRKDGNLEHIIDSMNVLELEFCKQRRKGKRIHPIDDGIHAEKLCD
jgi:hypothetical protein